jgi:hypothetical protein
MTSFHYVQYPRPWTEKRLLLKVLAQMGLALPADQMRSVHSLTLALAGVPAKGLQAERFALFLQNSVRPSSTYGATRSSNCER